VHDACPKKASIGLRSRQGRRRDDSSGAPRHRHPPRAILARRDRPLRAQSARQARRALLQQELQAPQRPEQSAWRPAQAGRAPAQEQLRELQARSRGCAGRGRSGGLPRGPEPGGLAQRVQAQPQEPPLQRAREQAGDPRSATEGLTEAQSPSAPWAPEPPADLQAVGCVACSKVCSALPPVRPTQAPAQRPGQAATEPSSTAVCSGPSAHLSSIQTWCRTGRRATASRRAPVPAPPAGCDRESSLRAQPPVHPR
jgi:hypothetical protein